MNYKEDEYGVWVVYGEDKSAGNIFERPQIPTLGYYEGAYKDVLNHAQTLREWKSWGKGGSLKKIEVTKI